MQDLTFNDETIAQKKNDQRIYSSPFVFSFKQS